MTAIRLTAVAMAIVAAVLSARADDDWLGGAKKDTPVRTDLSLAEGRSSIAGAEVWALKLDPQWIAPVAHFSQDGEFLYLLDKRGVVRKIETATMTERLRLSLAVPCSQIAMSQAGVVVTAEPHGDGPAKSQTLWVISPETLAIAHKITIAPTTTTSLATSPALDCAYVTDVRLPGMQRGTSVPLGRLNLRTGQLSAAEWVDPKDWPRSAPRHNREPVITPDGKYAMVTNSSSSLFRYRIDGAKLLYEDRSGDKGPGAAVGGVVLAAGGKVAYDLTISGNLDRQVVGRPGVYVYEILKLNKPAMVLPAKQGLVLDLQRERAFGLEDGRIVGMGTDGQERWTCELPSGKQFAGRPSGGLWLSPSGREMLAHAQTRGIYWLRVPDHITAVRDGDKAPAAAATDEASIKSAARKMQDITLSDLSLRPQDVLPDPLLDAEGKTLTVLSRQGVLRQYDMEDGKCRRKLDVGRPCAALGRSSEGIVVLASGPGEIWVLDGRTLAVKRRIPVAHAGEMACSDSLHWGFVLGGAASQSMATHVDLCTGQLSRTMSTVPDIQSIIREGQTQYKRFEGTQPRLTGDGRNLFTLTSSLHRWRWDGSRLLWAESVGMGASSALWGADFSDDGAYIPVCGPKTAVFWTRDIREPVLSNLELGPAQYDSGPVALDNIARRFYVVNREALHVFDALGRKQGSFLLPAPPQRLPKPLEDMTHDDLLSLVQRERKELYVANPGLRSIILAPRAHKMLVLTGYTSSWVELPPPAAKATASVGPMGQWLGDEALQERLAAKARRTSAETESQLSVEVREAGGVRIVTLGEKPDSIVTTILWSADGKCFFMLSKAGLLRQIALDPFREVRRLQLPQPCHTMAMSKHGLVLGGSRYGDIYLLSQETLGLQWKRAISEGPISRVFAVPAAEHALVEVIDTPLPSVAGPSRLAMISLENGTVVRAKVLATVKVPPTRLDEDPEKEEMRFPRFDEMALMHPDGRSVWTAAQRYVLSDDASMLLPSPALGQLATADSPANMDIPPKLSWLRFNGDGRYLAIQSADKIRGFPKVDHSATFIFRAEKPDKPLVTIQHDEDGGSVVFADARKLLYEYTCGGRLRVYRGNGDLLKEFEVNVKPARNEHDRIRNRQVIECLSVQPDGRGLITMTRDRVCHIRLPEEMFPNSGE